MEFSIIVPAFNEEAYLGSTLDAIQAASMELSAHSEDVGVELIVVDNNSGDATAAIARDKGARASARDRPRPQHRSTARPVGTCSYSSMPMCSCLPNC